MTKPRTPIGENALQRLLRQLQQLNQLLLTNPENEYIDLVLEPSGSSELRYTPIDGTGTQTLYAFADIDELQEYLAAQSLHRLLMTVP